MRVKPRLAKRMSLIQPFRVMELLARARALEAQGRSIIHMEVGEPDFETPRPIVEAGIRALGEGRTHYTPAVGLFELREAISQYYRDRYRVDVAPERVIVTPGASGALQLVLSVLIDPEAEVLMADPGYPCNRNFVHLVGGTPVGVPVDSTTNYQPNVNRLEARLSPRTAALLLASPSNPTGTVLTPASLRELYEFARDKGMHLIVDEIYHGLEYDTDPATTLSLSDEVFVINSFSKYFGMTGWRTGWVVAPEAYISDLDKLAQNIFLAASTPAQHAALAAFHPGTVEILEARKQEFRARRDYLLPELRKLGFEIPSIPQGAFYIYAGCERFTHDSFGFANELLDQIGVAITPGTDFGEHRAGIHVRFAYTTSMEHLREGVRRLREFLV